MRKTIDEFLNSRNYPQIKLRAVLFDMDGVLYDSMKNHAEAWYQTALENGIPCTKEEFYLYEGQTGRHTIDQLFRKNFGRGATPDEIKRIYTRKSELFTALGPAPVMPGAREVLQQTVEMGLIPVLVTGSGQSSLIDKLQDNFPGIFTAERMITAHDVHHGKPHPEPYLRGLEKAGVLPDEAIVVENAPLGVRAASEAGIFTVAVNTGPLTPECLYDEGASLVLDSMNELAAEFPALVENLNRVKR